MKKILITGASGFVGQNILPILSRKDFEIHAVDLIPRDKEYSYVQWHKCDLTNSSEVSDLMVKTEPTYLIHLAWFVKPGKWAIAPENFDWVQASIDLIKKFHQHGGKKLVIAGTGSEYDWKYGFCNETLTPTNSNTIYGVCKNALRQIVESYSDLVGMNYVWARLFFLYGPHENPNRLIAYVINSLLKGQTANCSHGNQVRDFLHSFDAANALAFLLESDYSGIVNIASGEPIKLKDLMNIAADELDAKKLLNLGAIPVAESDTDLVVADVNRLKKELGWKQKFNNYEGIKDTIDWWKNNSSHSKS